ncbi:GROWTH-REGULATING FACTOR 8 [Salix koriyanagi]|uniref:Growth-regulating factor n=1 Tax=Salix koriyanagi TaxID=2511006 RepID=A0A9Q0PVR4_9ROSI|nr:GROWTH-REGULATING FACTOR 8 [Salix koriyanagi]
MVMSCHHKPAAHELSSSRSGGDGGGGGGPTFYRASNHVACFGGEMTSVNERVLFTAAQLQELERQTTIYKYMLASAPVPPELLMPITRNQSNVLPSQSNSKITIILFVKFKSFCERVQNAYKGFMFSCVIVLTGSLGLVNIPSCNSPDPEPWRCKRTDGKKWRCSRDVAPDQKYCERHSHKSRPRSRKPVESNTHDFPRSMTSTINNNYSTNPQLFNQKPHFPRNLYMFPGVMASSVTSYDHPGSLEWLLKGETLPVSSNSSQEWQHLTTDVIKGYHNVNDIDREGVHSLQSQMLNDHCSMFLSPKSTALDRALNHSQTQAQVTWHFIDACPANSGRDNICKTTLVSSSETSALPQSALTILSMSSGSQSETSNEGNGSAQLGSSGIVGTTDRDHQSVNGLIRPQWTMTHGGSWPGGPLAEALCLGISGHAKTASNLASPCSSSCSPSADKN